MEYISVIQENFSYFSPGLKESVQDNWMYLFVGTALAYAYLKFSDKILTGMPKAYIDPKTGKKKIDTSYKTVYTKQPFGIIFMILLIAQIKFALIPQGIFIMLLAGFLVGICVLVTYERMNQQGK